MHTNGIHVGSEICLIPGPRELLSRDFQVFLTCVGSFISLQHKKYNIAKIRVAKALESAIFGDFDWKQKYV